MATLAQNIQRAINDFNSIENAIVQKGVPVPDGTPTSEYGKKILSIESGVDTSGDTVVPSALREGYTAHNAAGQEITGTIPNYDGSITEGATEGAQIKYDEGFADGKQAEYDAFWDVVLQNGKKVDLKYAFYQTNFSKETFSPPYDLRPITADNMFCRSWDGKQVRVSMSAVESSNGIIFDFSNCKNFNYAFAASVFCEFNVVDLSQATITSYLFYGGYSGNKSGKRINRLIFSGSTNIQEGMFGYCEELTHVGFEGTIGKNGLNLSWSPLDKESITSLVNALSATTTGLTVTLRLAAVNTAFETTAGAADGSTSDEWTVLIATKPNWTINLINS